MGKRVPLDLGLSLCDAEPHVGDEEDACTERGPRLLRIGDGEVKSSQ